MQFKKNPAKSFRSSNNSRQQPASSKKRETTSWEGVGGWYQQIVGESGHYYHQAVILPKLLKMLAAKPGHSLLDLACGQGVLARALPDTVQYQGLDLAAGLIKMARKQATGKQQDFAVQDITQPFTLQKKDFDYATIILALQNLEQPLEALKNARKHLKEQGKLFIVLNHPCFRIPRQSSWQVDEAKKVQYRRIDRYMSAMKIPIQTHPGKPSKETETWSFHYSLTDIVQWLASAGFQISSMQEWCSDKQSTGKNAKMEDRAREEIPLFLTIEAVAC